MKHYVNQVLLLAAACLGLTCFAQTAEEYPSVWKPGYNYTTTVGYRFSMYNATLTAGTNKPYHADGNIQIPYLEILPIVRFHTRGIQKNGVNFHARRNYETPNVTCEGSNLTWHSKSKLKAPVAWLRLFRDKDVRALRHAANKIEDSGGCLNETFDVFGLGVDKSTFHADTDVLYLKWTDQMVKHYRERRENGLEVRIDNDPKAYLPPYEQHERPDAPHVIRDTIRSEWNLAACMNFGMGKHDSVTKEPGRHKPWRVSAKWLHSLIAVEKLRRMLKVYGTLEFQQRSVNIDEIRKIPAFGENVFDAVCFQAVGQDGFAIKFDTGGDLRDNMFIDVGPENGQSHIEVWFDRKSEVLRYALIKIHCDDYHGSIPNPGIGENISALEGFVEGRLDFACEYITEITPDMSFPRGTNTNIGQVALNPHVADCGPNHAATCVCALVPQKTIVEDEDERYELIYDGIELKERFKGDTSGWTRYTHRQCKGDGTCLFSCEGNKKLYRIQVKDKELTQKRESESVVDSGTITFVLE